MPIEVLYDGRGSENRQPAIDIVAIHGLNPWNNEEHATDTWEEKKSGNLWLRDQLPSEQPEARTMLYEYNSSPAFSVDKERFIFQANDLLEDLRLERSLDPLRPLILVGHSLGGILIKQALVNAHANAKYKDILSSTRGLMFFGTPHTGPEPSMKVKFGETCVAIANSLPWKSSTKNDVMQALKKGSLFSDVLGEHWRHQLELYQIVSFWEGIGNLVPKESAELGLGGLRENVVRLNAIHEDMCRYDLANKNDMNNYKKVKGNMADLCTYALKEVRIIETAEKKAVMKSLAHFGQNPRFNSMSTAHQESLHWIWKKGKDGPEFQDWLQCSKNSLYWITGKPGAGKSTLMQYIYQEARFLTFASANQNYKGIFRKMYFFFYDLGEPQEKSIDGCLHSILHQILSAFPCLVHHVFRVYKRTSQTNQPQKGAALWSQSELKEAMAIVARNFEKVENVLLVLDGLDECHGDYTGHLKYLMEWANLINVDQPRIRILVASRPEIDIQLWMVEQQYKQLKIHEWTGTDVSRYVASRLNDTRQTLELAGIHGAARRIDQDLINAVVERAAGVFLWVHLVVEDLIRGLKNGDTSEELQDRVSRLPSDLKALYENIVSKIPPNYLHDSINYFGLVRNEASLKLRDFALAAQDPQLAISSEPVYGEDVEVSKAKEHDRCQIMRLRVSSRSLGLLQVESQHNVEPSCMDHVTLLHRTVEEYVLKADWYRVKISELDGTIRDPNVCLMAMCLQYIKSDARFAPPCVCGRLGDPRRTEAEINEAEIILERFASYAKSSETSSKAPQTRFLKELDRYCSRARRFWQPHNCSGRSWIEAYYNTKVSDDNKSWETDILCLAIRWKLHLSVKDMLRTSPQIIHLKTGRPYLMYAFDVDQSVNEMSKNLVTLLVKRGANPNESFNNMTAWEYALTIIAPQRFRFGWDKIFEVMLKYHANANQKVHKGDTFTTAFHLAVELIGYNSRVIPSRYLDRHPSSNMIKLFLEHGGNPQATDSSGLTVLDTAKNAFAASSPVLRDLIGKSKSLKRPRPSSSSTNHAE